MTIQDITNCPNPLNGIYNPTAEMKYAAGYRIVPPLPVVEDGYKRVSAELVDDDGVWAKWVVIDRLTTDIEREAREADLAANGVLYSLQNQYMTLCGQLTGQAPCKLGFAELQSIITGMQSTNPEMAMGLALQLLTLDAALKREGGLKWWDACKWTEGFPQ